MAKLIYKFSLCFFEIVMIEAKIYFEIIKKTSAQFCTDVFK